MISFQKESISDVYYLTSKCKWEAQAETFGMALKRSSVKVYIDATVHGHFLRGFFSLGRSFLPTVVPFAKYVESFEVG